MHQADALAVYQSARRTINDKLGLEPCRPLQDLQRAILTADYGLDGRPGGTDRAAAPG